MAGRRRARGDRAVRLSIGLATLTIVGVPMVTIWASRRHPERLLHTTGFWIGAFLVLIAFVVLFTTIPIFQKPDLRILVGNELPFRRNMAPDDTDVEMVEHTDKSRVGVRLTLIQVVEQKRRGAENVRVEVIAVAPAQISHSSLECLNWYSKDSLQEVASIAPGGQKWAILEYNIINEDDVGKSRHRGLANLDEYVAVLAVSWDGKLVHVVTVKVSGWRNVIRGDVNTGFATVEIVGRPTLRYVHKLNKKRIAERIATK